MTDKEIPQFIDISIADKFTLRYMKLENTESEEPLYLMHGTEEAFKQLQEHIDSVFPRSTTNS